MKRIVLIGFALCVGCEQEKQPEPTDSEEQAPIAAGRTLDRALECPGGPAWVKALADGGCREGSYIYAAGHASKMPNRAIHFHAASDRARAALAQEDAQRIQGSEIVDVARCDQSIWALARREAPEGSSTPSCSDDVIQSRAAVPDGCPSWSTSLSRIEGERVTGVGFADAVRNPELARRLAANRAIHEQRKSLVLRVSRGEDGVRTSSVSQVVTQKEEEVVERCGGMLVARVTSRIVKP
ncbi:MAG: hypothetical protein AAFQ65_12290 [Myxococcota bacterium]